MSASFNQYQSRSLSDWLYYLEHQHHSAIDLGLERVAKVAKHAKLTRLPAKVITVAGTNGKGSTCALLEQLLLSEGYRVGVYSSPHIVDYRERVRINGQLPGEQAFCDAFAAIEGLRADTSLSYFEFGTLAAIWMFAQQRLDYVILEVGLGGRLDATNIVEPDVSVVTTVALDHVDWLGSDLQQIGREKAGIFRPAGKVVIGDTDIVDSVLQCSKQLQCQQLAAGHQYTVVQAEDGWSYHGQKLHYQQLPYPKLPLANAATVLAIVEHLGLSPEPSAVASAVANWQLAGRLQTLSTEPFVVVDVAHNPQSAGYLASQLENISKGRSVVAVCAMLTDKDIDASLAPLMDKVSYWHISGLSHPRGDDGSALAEVLKHEQNVERHASVKQAYSTAFNSLDKQSMLIVFGSFFTVAETLELSPAKP